MEFSHLYLNLTPSWGPPSCINGCQPLSTLMVGTWSLESLVFRGCHLPGDFPNWCWESNDSGALGDIISQNCVFLHVPQPHFHKETRQIVPQGFGVDPLKIELQPRSGPVHIKHPINGPNGMWKLPTSTMVSFRGCLIWTGEGISNVETAEPKSASGVVSAEWLRRCAVCQQQTAFSEGSRWKPDIPGANVRALQGLHQNIPEWVPPLPLLPCWDQKRKGSETPLVKSGHHLDCCEVHKEQAWRRTGWADQKWCRHGSHVDRILIPTNDQPIYYKS